MIKIIGGDIKIKKKCYQIFGLCSANCNGVCLSKKKCNNSSIKGIQKSLNTALKICKDEGFDEFKDIKNIKII
jgi:hypothetical protein